MNARSVQGNSPGEINAAYPAFLTDDLQPMLPLFFACIQKYRIELSDRLTRNGFELSWTNALPEQPYLFHYH